MKSGIAFLFRTLAVAVCALGFMAVIQLVEDHGDQLIQFAF